MLKPVEASSDQNDVMPREFFGFSPEDLERFAVAISHLLSQGTHLELTRHPHTQMILVEGRSDDDLVRIQAQGRKNFRQLIVAAIEGNAGYHIHFNGYVDPAAELRPTPIERFQTGTMSPGAKRIYRNPKSVGFTIDHPTPPTHDDVHLLIALLERTLADQSLTKEAADAVASRGMYRLQEEHVIQSKRGGGLLYALSRLLG